VPDSLDGVAASHWLRYCCYRSPPFSCPHPESLMLARSFLPLISIPFYFVPCKKMLKGSETDEKESSSETFAAAQPWNCLNVADFKRNPRLADEADGEQPNTETQIAVDASRQQLLPVRCYMRVCGRHLSISPENTSVYLLYSQGWLRSFCRMLRFFFLKGIR